MTTNWHPCFDDLSREESEQHDWVYGEDREEAGLGYQVNDVLLIPAWGQICRNGLPVVFSIPSNTCVVNTAFRTVQIRYLIPPPLALSSFDIRIQFSHRVERCSSSIVYCLVPN